MVRILMFTPEKRLDAALDIARSAGDVLLSYWGATEPLSPTKKGKVDLLTAADRVVWVAAEAEVRLRRGAGEVGRQQGLPRLETLLGATEPLGGALARAFPPARLAHLQVDGTDALRPARALAPPAGPALS